MTINRATSPNLPIDGRVMLDVHSLKALPLGRGGREILSAQFQERRLCLTRAAINRAESGKPVPWNVPRQGQRISKVVPLPNSLRAVM